MLDDVIANKVATIERCIGRVREEYRDDPARLDSVTVEDSVVLNLQGACVASIDLAMRIVSMRRLRIARR